MLTRRTCTYYDTTQPVHLTYHQTEIHVECVRQSASGACSKCGSVDASEIRRPVLTDVFILLVSNIASLVTTAIQRHRTTAVFLLALLLGTRPKHHLVEMLWLPLQHATHNLLEVGRVFGARTNWHQTFESWLGGRCEDTILRGLVTRKNTTKQYRTKSETTWDVK